MCASYCDYGYFTEENVKEAEAFYKGEPYTEWDLIPLDYSVYKYKIQDYESLAINEGIKLKLASPEKRVLVKSEHWCSGTEIIWVLEILSEDTVKILSDFYKDLPTILESMKLKYG